MKKITYNKQYLDNKDIKEVIKSLKNDLITTDLSLKVLKINYRNILE